MRMAKYKAATLACLDASSWALFLALPASRSFTMPALHEPKNALQSQSLWSMAHSKHGKKEEE